MINDRRYARLVSRMTRLMKDDIISGRSTPGVPVGNDTENDWQQIKSILQ